MPVLAGAAEANIKETLAACEAYREYGAAAVAIVSPFYYRLSADAVYAYFREIALNSPIDVTLYNIPIFASPIDVPTIQRLAELDRIVGIKDSSGDMGAMLQMIRNIKPQRPDFVFLCGWDTTLLPMLAMGCDGGTNALSGVVPDLFRRLYNAARAGDLQTGRQLQLDLLPLFDAIVNSIDFPIGLRAAVALKGFKAGESRQPLGDSQRADLSRISQRIGQCLTELGYEPQPTETEA